MEVGPPVGLRGQALNHLVLRLAEDRRGERQAKGAPDASGGDQEDVPERPGVSSSGVAVEASQFSYLTSKPRVIAPPSGPSVAGARVRAKRCRALRSSVQVGPRRGAGPRPWRRSRRRTDVAPTRMPSLRSSPWMRTQPQLRFSRPRRTISSTSSALIGGRPGPLCPAKLAISVVGLLCANATAWPV